MQIKLASKLLIALMLTSFLSACGVLAVGGVAASAAVLADRRSPNVQAIDKGIELEAAMRCLSDLVITHTSTSLRSIKKC